MSSLILESIFIIVSDAICKNHYGRLGYSEGNNHFAQITNFDYVDSDKSEWCKDPVQEL